jgi:hypothetical protein
VGLIYDSHPMGLLYFIRPLDLALSFEVPLKGLFPLSYYCNHKESQERDGKKAIDMGGLFLAAWIGCFLFESISNGAQYVTPDSKIYCEKVKMCLFAQEIAFSAPNSSSWPWLVKGATQVCAPPTKKECNQLDLTAAAQNF